PMPAHKRPGSNTTFAFGFVKPVASSMRNAPTMGEPSRNATAANAPAAPTTAITWSGAFRNHNPIAASPLPSATSGPSGPTPAPKHREASAASRTPGMSAGLGGAPALTPSAGEWPPFPGRYSMAAPAINPPAASIGKGHQPGACSHPSKAG